MEAIFDEVSSILNQFDPISLEQMSGIKLMNRIDTKYLINVNQLPILLRMAQNDYFAQEIDGSRIASYRTVYYDTQDAEMYVVHHNRKLNRQKIRMREYVGSGQFFLEIKNKNNKGRTKKVRIKMTDDAVESHPEVVDFIAEKSFYTMDRLSPRLQNRFSRITLVNKAKTERLTIDLNVRFHNFKTNEDGGISKLCIIELKQDGNQYSPFRDYFMQLRIKQKRISKYCLGMVLTDQSLKNNRFREKVFYINRL
ncbi:MAG: polyphosphate polymerase domain-containing protein [Paludibacteraceae bacterium]|nr:polyphosphate polymerase domain-containing protein [Paludibacteraceae bacterium]MBR4841154.1 polyphosphate polymerase domain-containing protein [Paludibacteraceae bacterium]